MSHTANASKKNTSKKAKAILAGGLVLGVGAAVTLASWTDEEWANASFSSGSFVMQSSTSTALNDDSFNSHSGDNAAELNFEMPATGKLGPNEKVAAPLTLRLNDKTTHDAKVTMTTNVDQPIGGLQYAAFKVDSPQECSTEQQDVTLTDLGSMPAAFPTINLEAGDGNNPGTPYTLCFVVSADGGLEQDKKAEASWKFAGKSVEVTN